METIDPTISLNDRITSDKVISFPSPLQPQSYLERYKSALLKTIHRVFHKDLLSLHLPKRLPLIEYKECPHSSDALFIYLLCEADRSREIYLFFHEMVSHWLVPEQQLSILSSRTLTFNLAAKDSRPFYFAELLLQMDKGKQSEIIHLNLPGIIDEIRLGVKSPSQAKHILEMKRLSLAGKTSFIYETIVTLMRRYPQKFEHDIFREIQSFLIHCREDFRKTRNIRHLCRIICSQYLFKKAVKQDMKAFPHKRHLYLKLLTSHIYYPFGVKKVIGISITLNSLREHECFEQRHILNAIQQIIPNAKTTQDSFYSYKNEDKNILSLYLEIEKSKEDDFTLEELIQLRKKLPRELKNSIEYLSPSLFIPRNEEELYRNIIVLSQELKYVKDLPQAIISFQEQKADILKFNIILLRILDSKKTSLQELSEKQPTHLRFIWERVANVGFLRKKYIKEANVFSLEMENQLFLRKNHSVDLIKARQHVVKVLESLIGPFRDYNGGLLLKQNEQLDSIKKSLEDEGKEHEFLIENLFYSLSPSIMQTIISPEMGKSLCSLFLKTLNIDLIKLKSFHIEKHLGNDYLCVVIKTNNFEIKENILGDVKKLNIDSFRLGISQLESDGHHYLCHVYLSPTPLEVSSFLSFIEETLRHSIYLQNKQQVLNIALPRAAQSLDPRIGTDRTSGIVIKMLYEGLMRVNKEGKVEPAVAESVSVSSDWKRYVFILKDTVWSNGSSLTAYDFEYAWKKILEPDFRSSYAFLMFSIKNAEAAKKGEKPINQVGIKAVNENTLVVELEHSAPYFLGLTAHWTFSPLCKDMDQRHPGWAYHSGDSYVCNGPFKLDMWKLNGDLHLIKNPFYWDASNVKLAKAHVHIIENEKMTLDLFKRGKLDWVGDPFSKIPVQSISELKKNQEIRHKAFDGLFCLQINCRCIPFHTAKLRWAFALAIDRTHIIKNILHSDDVPAYQLYRAPPEKAIQYFKDGDVKTAQLLFKEGLNECGMTVEDLPTIVITHSDIEEHEKVNQEIGKQWEKAFGVKVRYERLLWNVFFENLYKDGFMAGALVWHSRYHDPMYFLDLLVYREHAARIAQWKNAKYKDLITQAKFENDAHRKEQLILTAEKMAFDEMPLIPLFFQTWRYLQNPNLKGVILSEISQVDFRNTYLEN